MTAFLRKHWLLLSLIAAGIPVRIYRFGDVPPGFNQDEISTVYDAWSILTAGIDRNGVHLPLFLISWGDGSQALPAYLMVPFLWLLGVTPVSIRISALVLNLTSLAVFPLLTKRIAGERASLIAAFLLAINPWHIMASRWAHEFNYLPALALIGIALLASGLAGKKHGKILLAIAILCISLYAYGPAYFFVPVFLALMAGYALWQRQLPLQIGIACAATTAVGALPLLLFLLINRHVIPPIETPLLSIPLLPVVPRYEMATSLYDADMARSTLENLRTLWHLILFQDDGLPWNAIGGYGTLYLFTLPFAAWGCVLLTRRVIGRGRPFDAPAASVLCWLIAAIALGAAAHPNLNRINLVWFPLLLLAAVGIDAVILARSLLIATITVYTLTFGSFAATYFGDYAERMSPVFFESFIEAITVASTSTTERVCVTNQVNMPAIFAALAGEVDPRSFASTVQYEDPRAEVRNVIAVDRYVFGLRRCAGQAFGAYVLGLAEEAAFPAGRFRLTRLKRYIVAVPR